MFATILKDRERVFLLVCQVLAFGLLIFNINRLHQINELIATHSLGKFKVLDTYCSMGHLGSSIKIEYEKGTHFLEYHGKKCFEFSKGDFIELYYSKEHDFFYIPGSPLIYRYIYGLIGFLLWSFIPWSRMGIRIKKQFLGKSSSKKGV
ncbi:MAG TPA: hypothetical protein VIM65_13595 [Cyclobacteriaceae bacterium]